MLKTQVQSSEFTAFIKNLMNSDDEMEHDPLLVPTKGTLIVCPLSTVSNWEDQIQSHVKRGALSVYVYHGASRKISYILYLTVKVARILELCLNS